MGRLLSPGAHTANAAACVRARRESRSARWAGPAARYLEGRGSPSVGNSNVSPPRWATRVPAPKGLPLLGKNTAPSVDWPERSLVATRAMAEAAAPALILVETPSASALWRRDSYPLLVCMLMLP